MLKYLFALVLISLSALAQDSTEFDLGKIDVVARRQEIGEVSNTQVGSVVSKKDIQNNNRTNVGDALNLLSGVTMSTNARNEKIISIRGFDSRQVPLFIDGIPVYVPFDGYVDFNRFTTADLASIQVSKGFSSIGYGPNTLGGAVNLISRRPSKPLEFDFTTGAGSGDERRAATNIGTNQGKWYLQTGASYLESDGFPLSSDFRDTPTEGGGQRNNSYKKDGKLSAKVGYTPKDGDEYALSYYLQNGVKGQPPSTDPARARYWQWPYWNKQSVYFVSQTAITSNEVIKARLYHDQFDNKINTYTDGNYDTLRTSGMGSVSTGKSIYHDRTNGGSLTLESYRLASHTLTFVSHYKGDEHREVDARNAKNTFFKDELISIGAEDSIKLGEKTILSLGASHYHLRPDQVYSRGNAYQVPRSQTANEWQAGLFYDQSKSSRFYTTVARKIRMPTLKDRYSQRLGTFIANPGLKAEQSLNLELGHKGTFSTGTKTEIAFFSSNVTDKIQTVLNVNGNQSQVQNADKVRIYGTELGLKQNIGTSLEVGGNYTYTYIKNVYDNVTKITDVPRHKLIANANWKATSALTVIPFLEYNSRRWTSNIKELPGFTIYNLKAAYALPHGITLDAGVTNLSDKNYSFSDGFPSAGRMLFANATFEL